MPGLSLVCGLAVVAFREIAFRRGRVWRYGVTLLLVGATADTAWRLVSRFRSIEDEDYEWTESLDTVTKATSPEGRVFFWGFCPDCYVHARRLPASRYIYTTFLTGLVPWANVDPLIDTRGLVTPGSWDRLREDFFRHEPEMIIGTGAIRYQNKYPLHESGWLWSYVTEKYAQVGLSGDALRDFSFYRRLEDDVAGRALPDSEPSSPEIRAVLGFTPHASPTPQVVVRGPEGATAVELYADGALCRSLSLHDGDPEVAFFVRLGELRSPMVSFRAVMVYGERRLASAPVVIERGVIESHLAHAPGPSIRVAGLELRPVGSETRDGQPKFRGDGSGVWDAPASAKVRYRRPAGLRSFTVAFGLNEDYYYDRPGQRASDGIDLVVENTPEAGETERLYTRRLFPKVNAGDCGPQTQEIVFARSEPGMIEIRLFSGSEANDENDWSYFLEMEGAAYGPAAAFGADRILGERVSAHRDPVMVCDSNGRWVAHSPSSVSYRPPPGATTFRIGFGLESASYDGSQGGRTDGIGLAVVGQDEAGEVRTLFRRVLAPAEVVGDRGTQSAVVALPADGLRLITVNVDAGPHGNDAFDWSYLEDPRFETEQGEASSGGE